MAIINILDCGAVGDGKTLCTNAIASAVEQCEKLGGALSMFPLVHI